MDKQIPTSDPSVAQLIEETETDLTRLRNLAGALINAPSTDVRTQEVVRQLITALEQQVTARGEAEDRLRVLSVRIGTPIQQLRDVADVDRENERLQRQVKAARTVLTNHINEVEDAGACHLTDLQVALDQLGENAASSPADSELQQMNAVLKYDWLALCGLRESYDIARTVLTAIIDEDDLGDVRTAAVAALGLMIDPPPENVKYQGSWPWAFAGLKTGRRATNPDLRHGDFYIELRGTTFFIVSEHPKRQVRISLDATDLDRCDWQLEDTPTGESEANDE